MLILVTIALCLGVVGAAVWMTLLDADKAGSAKSSVFSRVPGLGAMGSRSQSFDSQSYPLVETHGQHAPQTQQHWGLSHWQHNHPNFHLPGMGHGGPWGHAAYGQHHPQGQQGYGNHGYSQGYNMGPSRDMLMQYAHQGY